MDLRRADLHTHTNHSDGALTPTQLVRKARQQGLQALSITDHDCIDGLAEALTAGAKYNVEVVAGVELSVTVGTVEIHLLGYLFDPAHVDLQAYLHQFRQHRYHRAAGMVERLHDAGLPVSMDTVLAEAGDGVLGRPHVARALVADGLLDSYEAAFDHYLRDGAPAWVPKPKFPSGEALALLHEAGGIGVLAHPGHWTTDRVVMALIRDGLDGLETIHPAHDTMLTNYYSQIARDFVLMETGGSDYHGFRERDEECFGAYSIPYPQLARIRHRTRAHAKP